MSSIKEYSLIGGSGNGALFTDMALVPDRAIEQAYFWTETWQAWEAEATEDLRAGRYAEFGDIGTLLNDME